MKDKEYDVIKITDNGNYNIIDESGDWFSYPQDIFEIVEE